MKTLILTTFLLCTILCLQAKDFEFGRITQEEVNLKRYERDTTANAVVLKEYGTAYMITGSGLRIVFEHHVRIKILNAKGFEHGNIIIPVRRNDVNTFEKAYDIQGVTLTMTENGTLSKTELNPKQVYKENKSKYYDLVKFAMPNLQEGSIIEYMYRIESPFVYNFRTWEFQSDIPKIYSEYVPRIPAAYNYNISLRGPYKLTRQQADVEKDCFSTGSGLRADCSRLTFIMEHVPAFITEDHMTAPSNFISAMNFELKDYTNYNGATVKVTQDWKSIDQQLKREDWFGVQLKKKSLFKDQLTLVLAGKTTDLEKAKAVYAHIQNWFQWNNYYGKYSDEGIKKALERHTGSVADINLALITAMSAAGLNAEAVILSTRDNGTVNKLFPVVSDFNYVICKVNIDNNYYLLDATDPLLPFGLLPIRCINDQGRVISLDKPSYWIDLKATESEKKTYNLYLTLLENGKLSGKLLVTSSGYEAYKKRRSIKKFASIEEYVEDLDEQMPKAKIISSTINNLDKIDEPVQEMYELEIDAFDHLNHDRLLFNPFIFNKVTVNPFKMAERTYPVDWGAPSEARTTISVLLPEKFEVASYPEEVRLALPNNGGKFIAEIRMVGNTLTLQQMTQLSKSIYSPEEYGSLKELFNRIIHFQKSDVVLKKKK